METCPYLQNAPSIFVDLSYWSALTCMACTYCQVVILPHLKRWKYPFPTVLNFYQKKCHLEDLGWLKLIFLLIQSCMHTAAYTNMLTLLEGYVSHSLTSLHRMPYKPAIFCWNGDRRASKHAFRFVCFRREPCQHVTRGVQLGGLTCIHASVSGSPWVYGPVVPDKRQCKQWMSFLPNPFIHGMFLWHTSHEFVKTDLYLLSLISLRYAVWACQRSNCAEERRP